MGLALALAGAAPGPGPGAAIALPACAAATHHATVVVSHLQHSPSVVRVCVGFAEDQITGHQLVDRSGIEFGGSSYYGSQGTAVCQLDWEPQGYPPDCLDTSGPWWSVWTAHWNGAWTFSRSAGIDRLSIHDGDALGFRFADSGSQRAPDPPASTCPPPVPPSTPAAQPAPAPPRPALPPPASGWAGAIATQASPSPADPTPAASDQPPSPPAPSPTHPRQPASAHAAPAATLGWTAAAGFAAALIAALAAQLLLPRLRR